MAKSLSFTLGKCYRVHRADGTVVDFKIMGSDVELKPSGEKVNLQIALGTYLSVEEIPCK